MSDSVLLDRAVLESLNGLLFGDDGDPLDRARWMEQDFHFREGHACGFGLEQNFGGPCGVLAVVQSFMLRYLLFGPGRDKAGSIQELESLQTEELESSFGRALSEILTRSLPDVGTEERCVNLVIGSKTDFPERMRCLRIQSDVVEDVEAVIMQNLNFFLRGDISVMCFVWSLLLSRQIHQLQEDRDDPSLPLVQRFGHSSQDLVNLMICGRAVSNVHDGLKVLGGRQGISCSTESLQEDSCVLKGIPSRCPIGFLTILEAMRYSKVGSYLKYPSNPIWVIGSSSHYTVLFSCDESVGKLSKLQEEEQRVRQVFLEFDVQEDGFIPASMQPALLEALQLSENDRDTVSKGLDPDGMGIILWSNLWCAYASLISPLGSGTDILPQDSEWACSACTFLNSDLERLECEMCATARPVEHTAPRIAPCPAVESNVISEPTFFTLWHYNGMVSCLPAGGLTQIRVTRVDEGALQSQGNPHEPGIQEILQTRWTDALIEYDSPPSLS